MLKKSKKVLSFTLSILIFTSIFFSFPITTNAAVVEESGVGAGNQNVIDAQTWLNNTYSVIFNNFYYISKSVSD